MPSPLTATLNNLALLYVFPNAVVRVIFCTLIPCTFCAYLLQHKRLSAKTHLASASRLIQKGLEFDRQVVRDALIRDIRNWAQIAPHL
jgi:hypothetical protein